MHRTEHSFWILPEQSLEKRLTPIIQKLATDRNGIAFDPHVTVYSAPSNDPEAIAIAQRMINAFNGFRLAATGLDQTGRFTKTLFVQFAESPELRTMHDRIKTESTQPINYELNPHLSLLYTHMSESERETLCRGLKAPQGVYAFDRLRVSETEIPIENTEPIKRWRTVFEDKFRL